MFLENQGSQVEDGSDEIVGGGDADLSGAPVGGNAGGCGRSRSQTMLRMPNGELRVRSSGVRADPRANPRTTLSHKRPPSPASAR